MKFIKCLMNAFISCILLCLIIILMFVICSKILVSKENISSFISNANILNVDVNVLFNQEESGITLKDKIVSIAIENKIPKEIIEDILKSKQMNRLLGDFFNQTINYTINGSEKPKILEETVNDMKFIAKESLNSHINIMLEEEQLDLYIEDYCDSIANIVPDRNEIIGSIKVDIFKDILNFNVPYLYLIIFLVLILIMLINKSWYKFIEYLGITMLISGVLFVTMGSMEYIISKLILNQITVMQPFILSIITNLLTIWFKSGVLISFSSVVLILIYLTINRISNN